MFRFGGTFRLSSCLTVYSWFIIKNTQGLYFSLGSNTSLLMWLSPPLLAGDTPTFNKSVWDFGDKDSEGQHLSPQAGACGITVFLSLHLGSVSRVCGGEK